MLLVHATAAVPPSPGGNWVAIGHWDGVHRGHQAIIRNLVAGARAAGGQAVVMGFHPHAMAVLRPTEAPRQLQTVPERAETLAALGVDVHLVLPFTRELADTPPEEFVDEVLIRGLRARHVMVGFNFTFGRGGEGTAETLRELCRRHGVPVTVCPPLRVGGETVSSTLVRYLLAAGEVERAGELLGRPYSLSGTVVPGDRRGRLLGFPTANLALAEGRQLPGEGVYAVRVRVLPPDRHYLPPPGWPGDGEGPVYGGMANIGRRPTFGGEEVRVEVHLLDFCGDLYGQRLQVEFIARLRPERAFSGPEALRAQLEADAAASRAILAEYLPGRVP
ncbi:MAG: bifunctional riboflavin kinase/FAD synthetase [Bacillota bacterium]